jgi:hypothetical protein
MNISLESLRLPRFDRNDNQGGFKPGFEIGLDKNESACQPADFQDYQINALGLILKNSPSALA